MEHLVCGYKGEVGKAILKIFAADGVDIDSEHTTGIMFSPLKNTYDYLHICFGYSEAFESEVQRYQEKFKPKFTIVHSTVPVGVSRSLNAIHSPVRGLHPNLYEGIMTFEKFIGGGQASLVADEFRKHGLKVILCDNQETTELGKLLDTEYYRACIEFTHRAKQLSDKFNLNFNETFYIFNKSYNDGYIKLGYPEYQRPVLQPIMTKIKGHCVMPNSVLLKQSEDDISKRT